MRRTLEKLIKEYLKDYPKELRTERHITQNKMSEHFCMDVRTYSDLEHGKSAFSLVSFMLLLWEIGDRKYDLIDDIMEIIKRNKNNSDT